MDVFAGLRIGRIIGKTGASIIHCHTARAHTLGLMGRFFSGGKLIVSRRVDFPPKSGSASLWKYRRADYIITISSRIRDIMIDSGVPAEKLSLIPSGLKLEADIDLTAVRKLRAELDIGESEKVIGTVAALVGHKDYPTLLKCFVKVREKLPDVWLLALGEGDDLPEIQNLAHELGIAERVKFLGFRDDVRLFFGLFDVYVQSSRMEGLCSSLIEAMFHRLPIAATSAGGIPDLIEDGVTGLLSPPENQKLLAENIMTLLENGDLGVILGKAAREKSKFYTADNMVKKTEEIYLKLIEGADA